MRASVYWTYPEYRGRSWYWSHRAKTLPTPAGRGKLQDTIELDWFGTVWKSEALPPSKMRSPDVFFGEHVSGVGRLKPLTSCQSVPTPGGTRAETTGAPGVPTRTFPPKASVPPDAVASE